MANYAIMRMSKIKTFGQVAASLQHCYRERDTPNADPERTGHNQHLVKETRDKALNYGAPVKNSVHAMGRLRDRLPEKRRKDAVVCVEYVMTASPEWWESADQAQREKFVNGSMKWLEAKYGEENIIAATVHNDETSPHISAYCAPVTADGRLSAKEMIGDAKQMTKDQTEFAAQHEDIGLVRGVERSKAHHTTIREFYGRVAEDTEAASISPEDLKPQGGVLGMGSESPEQVAARLTAKAQAGSPKHAQKAVTALREASQARHGKEQAERKLETTEAAHEALKDEHRHTKGELRNWDHQFRGLTQEQFDKMMNWTDGARAHNAQKREQERQSKDRDIELS